VKKKKFRSGSASDLQIFPENGTFLLLDYKSKHLNFISIYVAADVRN
jgi:hypothetical protein